MFIEFKTTTVPQTNRFFNIPSTKNASEFFSALAASAEDFSINWPKYFDIPQEKGLGREASVEVCIRLANGVTPLLGCNWVVYVRLMNSLFFEIVGVFFNDNHQHPQKTVDFFREELQKHVKLGAVYCCGSKIGSPISQDHYRGQIMIVANTHLEHEGCLVDYELLCLDEDATVGGYQLNTYDVGFNSLLRSLEKDDGPGPLVICRETSEPNTFISHFKYAKHAFFETRFIKERQEKIVAFREWYRARNIYAGYEAHKLFREENELALAIQSEVDVIKRDQQQARAEAGQTHDVTKTHNTGSTPDFAVAGTSAVKVITPVTILADLQDTPTPTKAVVDLVEEVVMEITPKGMSVVFDEPPSDQDVDGVIPDFPATSNVWLTKNVFPPDYNPSQSDDEKATLRGEPVAPQFFGTVVADPGYTTDLPLSRDATTETTIQDSGVAYQYIVSGGLTDWYADYVMEPGIAKATRTGEAMMKSHVFDESDGSRIDTVRPVLSLASKLKAIATNNGENDEYENTPVHLRNPRVRVVNPVFGIMANTVNLFEDDLPTIISKIGVFEHSVITHPEYTGYVIRLCAHTAFYNGSDVLVHTKDDADETISVLVGGELDTVPEEWFTTTVGSTVDQQTTFFFNLFMKKVSDEYLKIFGQPISSDEWSQILANYEAGLGPKFMVLMPDATDKYRKGAISFCTWVDHPHEILPEKADTVCYYDHAEVYAMTDVLVSWDKMAVGGSPTAGDKLILTNVESVEDATAAEQALLIETSATQVI